MPKVAATREAVRFVAQAEALMDGRIMWVQLGTLHRDAVGAWSEIERYIKLTGPHMRFSSATGNLRVVRREVKTTDTYVSSIYVPKDHKGVQENA
jgi:hypothetical protein